MKIFYILLFSIFFSLVLNIFTIKVISIFDYEVLGLQSKSNSLIKIYSNVAKNRKIRLKIIIIGIVFIILNCIILTKIFRNFSFVLLRIYFKYYYLFLILYIFAFIDYVTCYVYTILSYPSIIFSTFLFMISFLKENRFSHNVETIFLICLFYLMIKKFRFLGEGDFDIILIISLTLGVLPTVFIFYLSVVMSGIIGGFIIVRNSFKFKNNKIAFVPFIFIATFLFIVTQI